MPVLCGRAEIGLAAQAVNVRFLHSRMARKAPDLLRSISCIRRHTGSRFWRYIVARHHYISSLQTSPAFDGSATPR